MRTFNVNVNGVLYQVEVEEIAAGAPADTASTMDSHIASLLFLITGSSLQFIRGATRNGIPQHQGV